MIPDWQRLSEEAPTVAALVVGLAKRTGCTPEAVLDAIAETLEQTQSREHLRLVHGDPQRAA
jgi:hypothetical protein